MNYFNENLRFLKNLNRINATRPENLEIITTPETTWLNNAENIISSGFQKNGIWYHSRRDPLKEAKKQIDFACEDKVNHLILLSSGIGYPLISVLENNQIESALVLETNPEVLFYMLSLVPIFKSNKDIYIYYCPDPVKDSLEEILPFFQNKNINKTGFYKHRAAFQAEPRSFSLLESQVTGILYKRSVNQATIVKFQSLWNKNLLLNIKQIVSSGNLNDIINAFQGKFKNIVICGAGPSLSESFENLGKFRNNYLMIAADTAFFPLVKNKIIPDIVISADPQWVNHFFVLNPDAHKSIWLLDPVVCYQSSHYLERLNANIFWWDSPFFIDQIIRDNNSRGEIAHGGSVSTNAFDLALKLNPEKIILTGQDMAFSSSLAHVKGSALESMIFFKNNRFSGFEGHNFKQLRAIPARKVSSTIGGVNNIYTNDKLLVFKNWFEDQAVKIDIRDKPVLINSTVSGSLLKNFSHISLEKVFSENQPEVKPKTRISINSDLNFEKNQLRNQFIKIQKDCIEIQNLYKENFTLSLALIKNKNKKNEIDKKLTINDQKIKKFNDINQILSLNSQKIILSITEMDAKNHDIQVVFYKLMYLSSKKFGNYLKKLIHILN
jgi:hypothetical protein